MAIYKPSRLEPDLSEVDFNQDNTFSCQVNTSGEKVMGYKMQIFSSDGKEQIYPEYNGRPTEYSQLSESNWITNKDTLNIPLRSLKFNPESYSCDDYAIEMLTTIKDGTPTGTATIIDSQKLINSIDAIKDEIRWAYNEASIKDGHLEATIKFQFYPFKFDDSGVAQSYRLMLNSSHKVIKADDLINLCGIQATNMLNTDRAEVSFKTIWTESYSNLVNGFDYQWNVRTYAGPPRWDFNSKQIINNSHNITPVCSGKLVGSTKYVVWCRLYSEKFIRECLRSVSGSSSSGGDSSEYTTTVHDALVAMMPKPMSYAVDGANAATVTKSFSSNSKFTSLWNDRPHITEAKIDELITLCKSEWEDYFDYLLANINYDDYIEFKVPITQKGSTIIGYDEPAEKKGPEAEGNYYRVRKKIDWVEKHLGVDGGFLKIETEKPFDFDYPNNTPFYIYPCSDEHTTTSFYINPTSDVNLADFVEIYASTSVATKARAAGENPGSTSRSNPPVYTSRKIVGYSSDTGEVRVVDAFTDAPTNGMAFRLFKHDIERNVYEEIMPKKNSDGYSDSIYRVVGGTYLGQHAVSAEKTYFSSSLKTCNNYYSGRPMSALNQLFIQPNINIKSDDTNPDEIIFEKDGEKYYVDIIKPPMIFNSVTQKWLDVTFETLDDSQWLISGDSLYIQNGLPLDENENIKSQYPYKVMTDFMDSMPKAYFYARESIQFNIKARNGYVSRYLANNYDQTYYDLDAGEEEQLLDYRYIQFRTSYKALGGQSIKYYKYLLYDDEEKLIASSETQYSNELTWEFNGLESGPVIEMPRKYTVAILVVDEYDRIFQQTATFGVYYDVQTDLVPLSLIYDCHEHAIQIDAIPTSSALTLDIDRVNGPFTVDTADFPFDKKYIYIPEGEAVNYCRLGLANDAEELLPLTFPKDCTLLTQFALTEDFLASIPNGGEMKVLSLSHLAQDSTELDETYEEYTLSFTSANRYYFDEETEKYKKFTDNAKFYLRKNDETEPLECFFPAVGGGKPKAYWSLAENISPAVNNQKLLTMLQSSIRYKVTSHLNILTPNPNIMYVLTANYTPWTGVLYPAGIYSYDPVLMDFVQNKQYQFIYLDDTTQLDEIDPSEVITPAGVLDTTTGKYVYLDNPYTVETEDGVEYLWIDDETYVNGVAVDIVNAGYFTIFIVLEGGSEKAYIVYKEGGMA